MTLIESIIFGYNLRFQFFNFIKLEHDSNLVSIDSLKHLLENLMNYAQKFSRFSEVICINFSSRANCNPIHSRNARNISCDIRYF